MLDGLAAAWAAPPAGAAVMDTPLELQQGLLPLPSTLADGLLPLPPSLPHSNPYNAAE